MRKPTFALFFCLNCVKKEVRSQLWSWTFQKIKCDVGNRIVRRWQSYSATLAIV